jgi:hypothetical protein
VNHKTGYAEVLVISRKYTFISGSNEQRAVIKRFLLRSDQLIMIQITSHKNITLLVTLRFMAELLTVLW